ncbi:MAG TPA: hypothetical protein VLM40_09340, partial [Gemmata sp.]|nr:hypothetical protein [Gemmata sp.]
NLGKFNSVLCWYQSLTRDSAFRTARTSPDDPRRELTREPVPAQDQRKNQPYAVSYVDVTVTLPKCNPDVRNELQNRREGELLSQVPRS